MKTEGEIAHQMVDLLFDAKKGEDTIIWEECDSDEKDYLPTNIQKNK